MNLSNCREAEPSRTLPQMGRHRLRCMPFTMAERHAVLPHASSIPDAVRNSLTDLRHEDPRRQGHHPRPAVLEHDAHFQTIVLRPTAGPGQKCSRGAGPNELRYQGTTPRPRPRPREGGRATPEIPAPRADPFGSPRWPREMGLGPKEAPLPIPRSLTHQGLEAIAMGFSIQVVPRIPAHG
jgi:hypothetical protein